MFCQKSGNIAHRRKPHLQQERMSALRESPPLRHSEQMQRLQHVLFATLLFGSVRYDSGCKSVPEMRTNVSTDCKGIGKTGRCEWEGKEALVDGEPFQRRERDAESFMYPGECPMALCI
jgi:hypothetical protein